MSKVTISGNASGTGVFTIAAPNSNTDRTLTLPDEAGTVLTSASDITNQARTGTPMFKAMMGDTAYSISNATYTKVPFNTVIADPLSDYDTTNYRYTPSVAGWYMVIARVRAGIQSNGDYIGLQLRANGSFFAALYDEDFYPTGSDMQMFGSTLIELNGSTDYIDVYGIVAEAGSSYFYGNGTVQYNSFEAFLVRAA